MVTFLDRLLYDIFVNNISNEKALSVSSRDIYDES